MLTLAAEMFPAMRSQMMSMAQKAGEVTWEQGLQLKGNCLCHGIAGNAYLMHNLYRTYMSLASTLTGDYKNTYEQ